MFTAPVLEKFSEFSAEVREMEDGFLPDGDVTIDVDYSTLNCEDTLVSRVRNSLNKYTDKVWPFRVSHMRFTGPTETAIESEA
ncbi:MAG: hypothetical protein ACK4OH_03265 [Acidovorax temperans]|uniref:hypothetical protein n=1 Tax=Acidovorax temperans TaxID=80878 RepID=UPI00391D30F1